MHLNTKFQLDRTKIDEVIPFFHFRVVGQLGRFISMDFAETFIFNVPYPYFIQKFEAIAHS